MFFAKQNKRVFWSISVQICFESVKSSIFYAPPKSNWEWLTTAYKRSGSSKVVTSNGERRQVTLSHNSVLRYLSTAFDNENYSLRFHSRQNSKKFYNALHVVGFRDELWLRLLGYKFFPWIRDRSRFWRVVRMSAEFITNFERWQSCRLLMLTTHWPTKNGHRTTKSM